MQMMVDEFFNKLKREAEQGGYKLAPDTEFVKELLAGLLKNKERYGYLACPCRLTRGSKTDDLDIICPCDYRDDDLKEFGMCYCGLYVGDKIARGEEEIHSIPDRRSQEGTTVERQSMTTAEAGQLHLSQPVYRCKVCGYLCARPEPPEVCPICKVSSERFERFI